MMFPGKLSYLHSVYLEKMKDNWPLFAGLALLTAGIIFRIIFDTAPFSTILIGAGIFLKVYFVFNRIKSTKYRPGVELLFLILGLTLFFSGMYLDKSFTVIEPVILKVTGIILKVIFVLLFIQKTKIKLKK